MIQGGDEDEDAADDPGPIRIRLVRGHLYNFVFKSFYMVT